MSKIVRIGGNNLDALVKGIKRQNNKSPLESSSISDGLTRIIGTAGLVVEEGGSQLVRGLLEVIGQLVVSGQLNLTGVLDGSGNGNWSGPWYQTGDFQVTGLTSLDGDTDITGNTDISGDLSITGNAEVESELVVGGMTLQPVLGIYSGIESATGIQLDTPFVLFSGGATVTGAAVFNATVRMPSLPTSTFPANVHVGALGTLTEVTSASAFKLDPQPMELDVRLLDEVAVKDWVDREAPDMPRVPGVIAEEVEAAGGEAFVGYRDGVIHSVAYDRLALARTQILAQKLEAALARIEELERSSSNAA